MGRESNGAGRDGDPVDLTEEGIATSKSQPSPIHASSKPCACGNVGYRWIAADPDIPAFVQCRECCDDFMVVMMGAGRNEKPALDMEWFEKRREKRRKSNHKERAK